MPPGLEVADIIRRHGPAYIHAHDGHLGRVTPQAFDRLMTSAGRQDWVVYAKPPFGAPDKVLAYLSRYTHRVAIANSRLVSMAEGKVTFRWRDYRNLSEIGKIVAQGAANATRLIAIVGDPDSGLPLDAIATLKVLVAALAHLEAEIGKLSALNIVTLAQPLDQPATEMLEIYRGTKRLRRIAPLAQQSEMLREPEERPLVHCPASRSRQGK